MLLWLELPLADDFCNFLNKIAKIMKIFVEVDLLKGYQPLCQGDQLFLRYLLYVDIRRGVPDDFAGHGIVGPRLPVHWRRHEDGSKLRVRMSASEIKQERGFDSRQGFLENTTG